MKFIKNSIRKLRSTLIYRIHNNVPEINISGHIVVVAPHPDDEIIGMGGLIHKLVTDHVAVNIVYLTSGEMSHDKCCRISPELTAYEREKASMRACNVLGVEAANMYFMRFKDGKLCCEYEIISQLNELIKALDPDYIFVTDGNDGWPEHEVACQMITSIAPPGCKVMTYFVWFWYYFRQYRFRIMLQNRLSDNEMLMKRKALATYMEAKAPCGESWCGTLPNLLIETSLKRKEYFSIIK